MLIVRRYFIQKVVLCCEHLVDIMSIVLTAVYCYSLEESTNAKEFDIKRLKCTVKLT